MLRALKARGLRAPRLVIADGHLGIWGAVGLVFPTVEEQRCWYHRIVNVLDTLPKQLQVPARELLTKIPYAETRGEAERLKQAFQAWAAKKGVPAAGRRLDSPELLPEVAEGVVYVDGVREKRGNEKAAA